MSTARPRNTRSVKDDSKVRDELRKHGLKGTASRIAVLSELQGASAPRSHAEIFAALADRGFDRATVYRNLIDLANKGLLVRSDLGDHVWRFELRSRPEKRGHGTEHPHFVCTDCGDVSCLPSVAVRLVATEGAPKSLSRRAVEVHVKGLCDNCA
jgi:Fur family ferric uptake transcriptional regulator